MDVCLPIWAGDGVCVYVCGGAGGSNLPQRGLVRDSV